MRSWVRVENGAECSLSETEEYDGGFAGGLPCSLAMVRKGYGRSATGAPQVTGRWNTCVPVPQTASSKSSPQEASTSARRCCSGFAVKADKDRVREAVNRPAGGNIGVVILRLLVNTKRQCLRYFVCPDNKPLPPPTIHTSRNHPQLSRCLCH